MYNEWYKPLKMHFTSWLRLAPNNKISGEKPLIPKTPKGSSYLKISLRNAANAIGNLKDTHLSNFFNRVCYRKGRTVAVSATARKLAVILWNMVVKKQPYSPPTEYLFLDEISIRAMLIPTENDILWIFHLTNKK